MLESSGRGLAAAEDPAHAQEALNGPDIPHPIYDDARKVIMDMRDAIAIKDPNLPQSLIEGFGQFAGPYALYSRMLGSFGTAANLFKGEGALAAFGNKVAAKAASTATAVGADAITNATANAPHDPRNADMFALHKDAEGKYVDMLSSIASPDNPLYPVHEYINYLASPDHSEAEGRFKNVLDGLNVFGALAGVFFGGAATFKTGWGAMHIMADNNMGSMSDLMPANQVGAIGDVKPTPRANNASGESAASLEAQSWVRAQKASGIKRYRLDPDGVPEPLMGLEGRDPRPMTGQPVVDFHKDGSHEIIDRGGMTKMQADGLVARAKALHGLGPKEEK